LKFKLLGSLLPLEYEILKFATVSDYNRFYDNGIKYY